MDRNTKFRDNSFLVLPVAAGARIDTGVMVAVNANGYAVPASDAAGLKGAGMAVSGVDNSAGLDGDARIEVRRGVFEWDNSAAKPVTQKDVLSDCYIADDHTVRAFDSTEGALNPRAGRVIEVVGNRVWVEQP